MTSFSFHPVKPVTTGEGGMVTTNDAELATRMRVFRNHGIVTDARQREEQGTWFYQMQSLGFNYRISDVQCALGIRQLQKLPGWIERRNQIADRYDRYLGAVADLTLLKRNCGHRHGFHLYVVRVAGGRRNQVFQTLRANGVGVNVHYVPVHLHPFYQERFGTHAGICPEAEAAFDEILSLPVYPGLTTEQQDTVIQQLTQALAGRHSRAA